MTTEIYNGQHNIAKINNRYNISHISDYWCVVKVTTITQYEISGNRQYTTLRLTTVQCDYNLDNPMLFV